MSYWFEGMAECNICHQEYKWYCVNLNLIKRDRGVPYDCSEPQGVNMSCNGCYEDGTPEFQGYCPHCGRTITLPRDIASVIPKKFYVSR